VTPKLYKAADVCEATGLQPYVLRSWEKEFPGIGVQKSPDSMRLYRESDIEQVRRIKHLVFSEGLTLAGARRRLEESSPRPSEASTSEMDEVLDTLSADARSRIDLVRSGLRSILEALSKRAGSLAIPELPRNGSSGGSGNVSSHKPTNAGKNARSNRGRAKRGAATRKTRSTKRKRAAQRY
jgi:DNA-binding transcriptional MerR regulator